MPVSNSQIGALISYVIWPVFDRDTKFDTITNSRHPRSKLMSVKFENA